MYNLNLKTLKSLAKLAPKSDVRYYLQGVYVDFQADQTLYAVCNGHYLVMVQEPASGDELLHMVIPRETLISQKFGYNDPEVYQMTVSGNNCTVRNTIFQPIDGNYPDWQKLIPDYEQIAINNPGQQFNPDYLKLISDCFQTVSGSKFPPAILYNKSDTGPGVIVGNDSFMGIIMPMRTEGSGIPDWFSNGRTQLKQVA